MTQGVAHRHPPGGEGFAGGEDELASFRDRDHRGRVAESMAHEMIHRTMVPRPGDAMRGRPLSAATQHPAGEAAVVCAVRRICALEIPKVTVSVRGS